MIPRLISEHIRALIAIAVLMLGVILAWRSTRGLRTRVRQEPELTPMQVQLTRLLDEHITIMHTYGTRSEESRQYILKHQYFPEFRDLAVTNLKLIEAYAAAEQED